ncbi:MAG: YkgJ family cysteine cluster protein [Gammaproteobacteria bacterium]|jgi:Fe-S-cluster containining protein|nr:YkgJ family cysteine cluster protein [Gammaproteobacteria bacterium]
MLCRPGCGACCVAPSINTPLPGMPDGKPAGVRCLHLDESNLCRLFGSVERPGFCAGFTASPEVCGDSREEAIRIIGWLEGETAANQRP